MGDPCSPGVGLDLLQRLNVKPGGLAVLEDGAPFVQVAGSIYPSTRHGSVTQAPGGS